MNYELAFGLRISALEKRMDAVEASSSKRKAGVLDEDEDVVVMEDDASSGAAEGGAGGAGEDVGDDFETILKGVLRHSKPAMDFEWARKQLNLLQTDPVDLDRYFTALIQSLVISGYVDSFTAWLNRFVSPVSSGLLKPRNVEVYVTKNLLILMNLQPATRGKQGKDLALATLKKRSTYEKVIGLARRVARGEDLSYEPSPAALQLQACPPKKARAAASSSSSAAAGGAGGGAGRKKKLFVQKEMSESSSEGEADESDDEAAPPAFAMGKGKGPYYEMMAKEAEEEAEEAEEPEQAEEEAEEPEEVEQAEEPEQAEEAEEEAEEDVPTQVQPATQVEMKKVDLLADSPSVATDFFMPQPVAAVSTGVSAGASSDLRSRFMAKKIISSSSSSAACVHPMMEESTPYNWEPLDVNRRSMVQTPTGALDSYLNWRKAFEADPRFENRYTEYTRPNGERSSLTGYYVRFFTAWPCIVVSSPEEVSSMEPQQVDTIYVRWLSTLSKTKTTESIREKLL